jgi:hypothetical protein
MYVYIYIYIYTYILTQTDKGVDISNCKCMCTYALNVEAATKSQLAFQWRRTLSRVLLSTNLYAHAHECRMRQCIFLILRGRTNKLAHSHTHARRYVHTQVHVIDASGLQLPGKGATFARIFFPYPREHPQEHRTPLSSEDKSKARDDANPIFDTLLTFEAAPTLQLKKHVERKVARLSVEMWCVTKVMFMAKNVLLGKVDLDLNPLLNSREIPAIAHDLKDEKGRKSVGGSITVGVSIRRAWSAEAKYKEIIEDVVIIDDLDAPKPPANVADEYQALLGTGPRKVPPANVPQRPERQADQGQVPAVKNQKPGPALAAGKAVAAGGAVEKVNPAKLESMYLDAKAKFEAGTLRKGMTDEQMRQCLKNTQDAYTIFSELLRLNGGKDYRYTLFR